MHEYTMGKIGKFIEENYCPEKMTKCDLEELYMWSKSFKNILEGDYYYNVICAMEESSNEETMEKLNQYSHEFQKYYTPSRDMDIDRNRMYYSTMDHEDFGNAPKSRAEYLKNTNSDNSTKMENLKKYTQDLMSDITEMLETGKATHEEKVAMKQWLAQYVNQM